MGEVITAIAATLPADVVPMLLDASLVAEHFLEKGGARVKYPTRYVLGCIKDDPNGVANFIHTGRWSS